MPNAFKKIFKTLARGPGDSAGGATQTTAIDSDSSPSETVSGVTGVWLSPDAGELKKQTAVKARKIEQPVFRIGRRVSDSISYPDNDPPEMLIFEKSPFTISKLHCQIEWDGDKVVLRDMGSRLGTFLGGKRLWSRSRKTTAVTVPKGRHVLILGNRNGPFRFRLEVA